jgi:hypothetical protein
MRTRRRRSRSSRRRAPNWPSVSAASRGVDAGAQAGSNKQFGALQKQRGELYDEMVAQIGREVKLVAQKRGINVVISDVVAPAGGVDLTADAEKDIESLHE